MTGSTLSQRERQERLLEQLMRRGEIQVEDMVSLFGVSRMTVHRDLDQLEAQQIVRKVRGGATVQPSVLFESNYDWRASVAVQEKHALAKAAIAQVEPGHAIIMDDSSTTRHLTALLPPLAPLTVITNAVGVLDDLIDAEGITLIGLGGTYHRTFRGFFGLICEQTLESLRADVAFLSSSAIRGTTVYHQDQSVVRIKRAMMAAADRRFLLIDQTKFGKSALHRFAGLSDFDEVLVGGALSAALREPLEAASIPHRVLSPTTKRT